MAGFTKLFSSIVTSSIWVEDDATLRIWIAMLATADATGFVAGTIPGFANLCRVTPEKMAEVERKLIGPDPHSGDPDNEGRRIQKVNKGWILLNYLKYRDVMCEEQRRDYMRGYMRDYRSKDRDKPVPVNTCKQSLAKLTQAEAEAEADHGTKKERTFPKLEEVKTRAQFIGMPESEAVAFWNHFEASGWIDKNGNPVVRWESKMDNWKASSRTAPVNGSPVQRPKTPMDLKTIIEAKQGIANDLRCKYCSETACDSIWTDKAKKTEYFNIHREIKALKAQLSKMA